MSKFFCTTCNKKFKDKFNLNRHLNKNNPCKNTSIFVKNGENGENGKKNEANIIPQEINVLQCQYCTKTFSSKYCVKKHIKNSCKSKKQIEEEKENILEKLIEERDEGLKEIENLKKQVIDQKVIILTNEVKSLKKINKQHVNTIKNSTINSHNTINSNNNITNNKITNNIIMVDHGKEDLSIIDNKHFAKLIKNTRLFGTNIPNEVLKIIHFNEEYPQLSNIYISDINRHKCMVYENNGWNLSPDDKIPEVVRKIIDYSSEKLDEFTEKYKDNDKIMSRIDILSKYNNLGCNDYLEEDATKHDVNKSKDFQKKTYDVICATLYNERKIPENNRKTNDGKMLT
jgi:hypothetical protein